MAEREIRHCEKHGDTEFALYSNGKSKHWKKLPTDAQLPTCPTFGTPPPVKPPHKISIQVTVGLSSQDELLEKYG